MITNRVLKNVGKITLKLAIFYDTPLLRKYNYKKRDLYDFVYRTLYSVSLIYRQKNMREIADIDFVIDIIEEYSAQIDELYNGSNYRDKFCRWFKSTRREYSKYASAILFTGYC